MRIIPVIDLLENQAVHAVMGEREHYKPVESILCKSSDPLELASAFGNRLGLDEIYIADLDAIRGNARSSHYRIIDALVSGKGFKVILDAGTSGIEGAIFWLDSGVHRVVIGSETLAAIKDLGEIAEAAGTDCLVFSLDCIKGRVLSKCTELSGLHPVTAMERIRSFGIKQIILLDLDRVGSGHGINFALSREARALFPDSELLVGGGVTGLEDIRTLQSLRVDGVLIATVLHRGILGAEQVIELRR
ncbi:MAG: HisA/HisF-related TIM barrel protein [Acidobacteriota bacterium]